MPISLPRRLGKNSRTNISKYYNSYDFNFPEGNVSRSSILVSEDEIRDVLDMILFTDFDWGETCRVATRKLWVMFYTIQEP
jgi:hypothetical protein